MRFEEVVVEAVVHEVPPRVVTSDEVEARLKPIYDRLRLPAGRLELMTGIRERRFWLPGTKPSAVAAVAGRKALETAGVGPEGIGCLIHAAVSRDYQEPATASLVHDRMHLSGDCQIFDLSNACLGVLNGMVVVASLIQTGQIERGLVVTGEVAEPLHEATIRELLQNRAIRRSSFKQHFASLTIGSGAAAVLLARADLAQTGHLLLGGAVRTDSDASHLCREDTTARAASAAGPLMATDAERLLHAGCDLAAGAWEELKTELGWTNETPEHVFTHQVGQAHKRLLFERLALDAETDYPTVDRFGNTGSAALPMAWAEGARRIPLEPGKTVALLGIGSGLSSCMLGVRW